MAIRQLVLGNILENCGLFFDEAAKEGVVIDPGDECHKITKALEKYGFKVTAILLTHGHFDHIGAANELKAKTGAKIFVHKADARMIEDPESNGSLLFRGEKISVKADGFLAEGDVIKAGSLELAVIHTPGHTKGSICLVSGKSIFTGDTLFCGGVGRTDLPSASYEDIMHSIKDKLFKYPDDTRSYPGHGYESTIGNERILY